MGHPQNPPGAGSLPRCARLLGGYRSRYLRRTPQDAPANKLQPSTCSRSPASSCSCTLTPRGAGARAAVVHHRQPGAHLPRPARHGARAGLRRIDVRSRRPRQHPRRRGQRPHAPGAEPRSHAAVPDPRRRQRHHRRRSAQRRPAPPAPAASVPPRRPRAAAAPACAAAARSRTSTSAAATTARAALIVKLTDPRTPINVRQQGNQILVDFAGTDAAEEPAAPLRRRSTSRTPVSRLRRGRAPAAARAS